MRFVSYSFGLCGIALATTAPVFAQNVMGNLAGSTPDITVASLIGTNDRDFGPSGTVGLDTLNFVSFQAVLNNNTAGALILPGGIFSEVAGVPGVQLAAFTPQSIAPGLATYTYTTVAPFSLSSSVRYFFVLDGFINGTPNSVEWFRGIGSPAPVSTPNMTFNDYQLRLNNGAWEFRDTNPLFQVNATVAPEPGTMALVSLGLIGGILARRRKP